jgi:hypothetical protein
VSSLDWHPLGALDQRRGTYPWRIAACWRLFSGLHGGAATAHQRPQRVDRGGGVELCTPNAAMSVGFVILFPITFLSNIFVEPDTMPAGLRAFADAFRSAIS